MESHAKLFGHPIHPMLIVFPLGLLSAGLIFDIIYKLTGSTQASIAGFWAISAGIVGGLLAAPFGFWDWLHIPAGTRAKAVGLWHGVGNLVIVILFILSWLYRRGEDNYTPEGIFFWLEVVAVILALGTAWLGGELVDRMGVGVDRGANLDSPNSLSGGPAYEGQSGSERRGLQ